MRLAMPIEDCPDLNAVGGTGCEIMILVLFAPAAASALVGEGGRTTRAARSQGPNGRLVHL